MESVEVESDNITPTSCISSFNISEHRKQVFGMFVGKEERVSIVIENSLIDAVMDKFGEDVQLEDRGNGTAVLNISVQISPMFIAWCCSFGDKLNVISPQKVITEIKNYITQLKDIYGIN